jgi:hypothetical protein
MQTELDTTRLQSYMSCIFDRFLICTFEYFDPFFLKLKHTLNCC